MQTMTEWWNSLHGWEYKKARFYHKSQFDMAWQRRGYLPDGHAMKSTMSLFYQYTWWFRDANQRHSKIKQGISPWA